MNQHRAGRRLARRRLHRIDHGTHEFDLEHGGAAANTGTLAVPPHFVDDLSKRITRCFVGEEIGGERVLGADGFSYPIGADGPLTAYSKMSSIFKTR